MTDPDDLHLSTCAALIRISGAGLALGLFLYFGKLALDEAVRLVFAPG